MTKSLLTRTMVTRVLFEQAKMAKVLVSWFYISEKERGSVSSEFKVRLDIAGNHYIFVVDNEMPLGELEEYLLDLMEDM